MAAALALAAQVDARRDPWRARRVFSDGLGEFFDEGVTCPADGIDCYAGFTGRGSQFVDDVRSWQTVEPAIDFTAAALLAFAVLR